MTLQQDKWILSSESLEDPIWYCLFVPPMKEAAACKFLRACGVYAFFPYEKRSRPVKKGHRKRITWKHPLVTSYIFARFTARPNWFALLSLSFITGVLTWRASQKPAPIPRSLIRVMQGLPAKAAELAQERDDCRRLVAGDTAQLIAGPLAGWVAKILEITDGKAVIVLKGHDASINTSVTSLVRA